MGGLSISRNAPCPCGSGRKYKRCCLADEEQAVREARFDDAVGRRIQDWSSNHLGDEITTALEEFVGPERVMDDELLERCGDLVAEMIRGPVLNPTADGVVEP